MKAFITGLVLIAVSGGALIWHLATRAAPAALTVGPARTVPCMVWRAERGHATVWLCGSFHLLREEDYPLPGPYGRAFAEARVLVTESPHDPAEATARRALVLQKGQWPPGERLEQHLSVEAWAKVRADCAEMGLDAGTLAPMKPWQAAFHVANYSMQSLGYQPARGLESYFSALAGSRTLAALETLEEQIARVDSLDAATQEAMLVRMAEEGKRAKERAGSLIEAWREGDARRLASLNAESMDELPAVRKALMEERHAVWLPQIEKYLDGTEPVMVLVGALHLCGRGSLLELLEAKGAKLTQMTWTTTRPVAAEGK